MTTVTEEAAGWASGWPAKLRRAATVVILAALASCGAADCSLECGLDSLVFYRSTWLYTNPNTMTVGPREAASAVVTVGYDRNLASSFTAIRNFAGVSVVPPTPGVTLTPTTDACVVPAAILNSRSNPACATYRLDVSADAIAAGAQYITLSAIWVNGAGQDPAQSIERVENFRITLTGPPPVVAPDFQLAVSAPTGGVYATVSTLAVSITRVGGFAQAVTLDFDGLGSGIAGSFVAQPTPTDSRALQLQIPARYAAGGRVDLRVTATAAGGQTRVVNFSQFIEPLFRVSVEPTAAALTTVSPLQVDVSVEPGNAFRSTSLGPVELTLSALPPGVTAEFVGDASPVAPVLPTLKVWRTLRLVTDGTQDVMGPLTIRGTARGVPADIYGVVPFVETRLDLSVLPGQFWQFVGNNLTYGTNEANGIGMALQSDDRPVFAWLEGTSGRVFMRRYDGTTFAPSPPRADLGFGLVVPALSVPRGIDEASFALTATDAGQVVFTYERGARLALGRANRAGVEWSVSPPFVVGDAASAATPRARSPRIATGPFADAVVVSYISEANAATTTGGVLHVLRSFGNGVLSELPTSLPGGALNASPVGSVVRHATALALRADGNPWVAWVEQPTDMTIPNRLWLRAYDGSDWGPAIAVPTPGTPVGASVQLLVEPSGGVVVAWLEGSPAQLKLLRYDPSSQAWTPLDATGNGRGSLNVTANSPALDVHLARHPDGRLLVTWTEGSADPRVWIKRRDADGVWRLVGTTVSQASRWSKTPRIVSDSNNRLYVAWATYAAGQNPGTPLPYAEIDVAQWIFP